MAEDTILTEVSEKVATLTLNRPDKWITPEGWKSGLEEVAPKVYAYILSLIHI